MNRGEAGGDEKGDGGKSRTKGGYEVITEVAKDAAKKVGDGGLIRATLGSCSCDNDEEVEGEAQRGHADDN